PGLDVDKITELRVETTADTQVVRIVRDQTGWRLAQPVGAADAQAIDTLLAAVRGGRWHRSGAALGTVRAKLTIVADRTVTLKVGAKLEGSDQAWIQRDDDTPVLVDGWVAAALAPDVLAVH